MIEGVEGMGDVVFWVFIIEFFFLMMKVCFLDVCECGDFCD